MRNSSNINKIIPILFMLNVFTITSSFSQHVLTIKNGTEITAVITCQTKDTVKYFLESNPGVIYVEAANIIYKISLVEPAQRLNP